MSIELIVSSRAEADLAAAFDWYQGRATDLGIDFLRCADATIAIIGRTPQIFRKRHGDDAAISLRHLFSLG